MDDDDLWRITPDEASAIRRLPEQVSGFVVRLEALEHTVERADDREERRIIALWAALHEGLAGAAVREPGLRVDWKLVVQFVGVAIVPVIVACIAGYFALRAGLQR